MAFDLSEVLKDVSTPDTGKQQIQYIDLARIDPDPDNFYSLEGIDELAGSIEMLGLQQPLLVRPTKDGRFVVISGHRRRAALLLIRDGGSQQFADGVPCIVDYSEASDALRELKLIMANSDTRRMSSADQNTQAERIEDLLRQLEDEGFEFPGRLRDWVAKLSGMSRSKLARLKVIRDKLAPEINKKYYKPGKLKEETAYELARLPDYVQRATVAMLVGKDTKPEYWWASTVKQYGEDVQRLETYTCPAKFGGGACVNQASMLEQIWKSSYRGYCHCSGGKKCCATCNELTSCSHVCGHMLPKAEELRRERRQKNKEMKEAEKAAQQPIVDRIRAIWLRFGNALGRANMEDEDLRKITGHKVYQLDSTQIASLEAGEYAPKIKAGCVLPFHNSSYLSNVDSYIKTADALDCSLDYLFLRTDVPEVNTCAQQEPAPARDLEAATYFRPDGKLSIDGIYTALDWQPGQPPRAGLYYCRVQVSSAYYKKGVYRWNGAQWDQPTTGVPCFQHIVSWWPLPEGEDEDDA